MSMKRKGFLFCTLLLCSMLLTLTTVGVARDLETVCPEPPSFHGCVKSLRDCRKYTMVSGFFLGEMSISILPDGSSSESVFVCMHYVFTPVFCPGNHLGVSSLSLVSYDHRHLSGSVVQNGNSYPVVGCFFVCGSFWSAVVSWDHVCYSVCGVLA